LIATKTYYAPDVARRATPAHYGGRRLTRPPRLTVPTTAISLPSAAIVLAW
jgi:hypothetical protein